MRVGDSSIVPNLLKQKKAFIRAYLDIFWKTLVCTTIQEVLNSRPCTVQFSLELLAQVFVANILLYTSVYLSEPYDVSTHTAVTSHSFSLLEWPQCIHSYSVHCSSEVLEFFAQKSVLDKEFKRQWKSNPNNDNFTTNFGSKLYS